MCIIQFVCDETRERKCILYIFEYDATLGETMYMIHFVYDATRGRQCILYILYMTQHEMSSPSSVASPRCPLFPLWPLPDVISFRCGLS